MSLLLLFKTDNAAKSMSAAGGAFALTGEASNLNEFHFVLASKGAFALSGGAATFSRTCLLTTASGAFSLTGKPAAFAHGENLVATGGSFTLTGFSSSAALVEPIVEFYSFSLTGGPATLTVGKAPAVLSCDPGMFAYSGGGAGLLVAVTEVGTAKFSWRSQALVGIVAQPAHASFNWKV